MSDNFNPWKSKKLGSGASKNSELQTCLSYVRSLEALEAMSKLAFDCAEKPEEVKYRKFAIHDKTIEAIMEGGDAAISVMMTMGWISDGGFFVLPVDISISKSEAQEVSAAHERLWQQQNIKQTNQRESNWFHQLFGFHEEPDGTRERWQEIQSKFRLIPVLGISQSEPQTLQCLENHKRWKVGTFTTPSLGEIRHSARSAFQRAREANPSFLRGRPSIRFVHGDVSQYLANEAFRHATFQVASQFNCLEFASPTLLPEDGVTIYELDRTQGPACSIACGPATVVRNYFAQSPERQINNLEDTLKVLENKFVEVRGGYTVSTGHGSLRALASLLRSKSVFRDGVVSDNFNQADLSCFVTSTAESAGAVYLRGLMDSLRVGVHAEVEVTSADWGSMQLGKGEQLVTQVFNSACSVAYAAGSTREWEAMARLVLDASYEACMWVAVERACAHEALSGSKTLVLTVLGGGVFGNPVQWIADAIGRAVYMLEAEGVELDIVVNIFTQDVPDSILRVAKIVNRKRED